MKITVVRQFDWGTLLTILRWWNVRRRITSWQKPSPSTPSSALTVKPGPSGVSPAWSAGCWPPTTGPVTSPTSPVGSTLTTVDNQELALQQQLHQQRQLYHRLQQLHPPLQIYQLQQQRKEQVFHLWLYYTFSSWLGPHNILCGSLEANNWDILMEHFDETFWWDILIKHFY